MCVYRYKEAPELLDPVLSELLTPLVGWLKKYMEGGNDTILNDTCQVLRRALLHLVVLPCALLRRASGCWCTLWLSCM